MFLLGWPKYIFWNDTMDCIHLCMYSINNLVLIYLILCKAALKQCNIVKKHCIDNLNWILASKIGLDYLGHRLTNLTIKQIAEDCKSTDHICYIKLNPNSLLCCLKPVKCKWKRKMGVGVFLFRWTSTKAMKKRKPHL